MMQDFVYDTQRSANNLLEHISQGMLVYDVMGERVGTVRFVRFGYETPDTPEVATATGYDEQSFISARTMIADPAEDLPDPLRKRLMHTGYIRIDTGIFRADCFATSDQIAAANHDSVTLSVRADELIRA